MFCKRLKLRRGAGGVPGFHVNALPGFMNHSLLPLSSIIDDQKRIGEQFYEKAYLSGHQ
jgi:hypothetical protein